MAGFRFRTRTKSKYDRPQPADSLLTQSMKLLDKTTNANGSAKVTREGARQKKQRAKSASRGNCFAEVITTEDVKKFFEQLMEHTRDDSKPTHKSALNEVIDFQEDVLRAKIATQAVNQQLEQLAQNRLQNLVDDIMEQNEEDDDDVVQSSNDYSQAHRQQNTTKEILTEQSPLRSHFDNNNNSTLNVNSSFMVTRKLQSGMKIRLSAEGLLDIVTKQVVEGDMSPSMMKRRRPSDIPVVAKAHNGGHQVSMDVKKETLLTPIQTEPSNQSLRQNVADNRETSSVVSKSTKLRLYPVKEAVPVLKPVSSFNSINNRAPADLSSEVADPKILTTTTKEAGIQPSNSASMLPISKKTSNSRSNLNLSRNSSRNSKNKILSSRKATMSQENLRIVEPKNDNEDLRNLVGPDEDENKFSQLAQVGNEANQSNTQDEELSKINTDVKLVELKLTHHGTTTHQNKKRLLSAGISRNQKISNNSLGNVNKMHSITNQHSRQELFADRRRSNASKSSGPLLIIGETHQEQVASQEKVIARTSLKKNESDKTWTQHINMSKIEEKASPQLRQQYHHVNTLLLSEKSQVTMEIKDGSLKSMSRPAPMQLSSPLLKNSDINSNQGESPESHRNQIHARSNLNLKIVDQSAAVYQKMPTENEVDQKKKELQLLLEQEIERLKGIKSLTPELAFIDPSQIQQNDMTRGPEEQLKFLEDTMKEHFKYSGNMQGGRPILSSRQLVQSMLHQKSLESKILETFKQKNETEKYDEFVNAQQLASAMMEMVTAKKNNPGSGGNVIIEPRDKSQLSRRGAGDGTGQAENPAINLKTVALDDATVASNNAKGDTLSYSPKTLEHQTLKQTVQSKTHREGQSSRSPRRPSVFKKEKLVQIKVRDSAMKVISPNSIDPSSLQETTLKSSHRKLYQLPTQLDLAEQENVSVNIATHNRKIVESRKIMSRRRDSRPDTLNQLKSPKADFEMSTLGLIPETTVQAIKLTEMIMSEQEGDVKSKSPMPRSISQTKSVGNIQTRKVHTKMQGGGFNRTQNSGYFKQRAVIDSTKGAGIIYQNTFESKESKLACTSSQVFVGERNQITPSEVWESQNRGMPMKLTLQVKQPMQQELRQMVQHTEKSLFSKAIETQMTIADDDKSPQNHDLKKEAKFELFPFKRGPSDRMNWTSVMKSGNTPLAMSDITKPQEMIVVVPSDGGIAPTPPNQAAQQKFDDTQILQQQSDTKVDDRQPKAVDSCNIKLSEGQSTAPNAVTDFRLSQKAASKKEVVQQSTLHLRASSTFGKEQSTDNSAKKLLLLSEHSESSQKKESFAASSRHIKLDQRKDKLPALEVSFQKQVLNSYDWRNNKILGGLDQQNTKGQEISHGVVHIDGVTVSQANISSTVQHNNSTSDPSLRVHDSHLISKEQIITQAIFKASEAAQSSSQKRETQMSITEKPDEHSSENESGLSNPVKNRSATWGHQVNQISRVSEILEEAQTNTLDSNMISPRAERRSVLQKSTMRNLESHNGVRKVSSDAAEYPQLSHPTMCELVATSEPVLVQMQGSGLGSGLGFKNGKALGLGQAQSEEIEQNDSEITVGGGEPVTSPHTPIDRHQLKQIVPGAAFPQKVSEIDEQQQEEAEQKTSEEVPAEVEEQVVPDCSRAAICRPQTVPAHQTRPQDYYGTTVAADQTSTYDQSLKNGGMIASRMTGGAGPKSSTVLNQRSSGGAPFVCHHQQQREQQQEALAVSAQATLGQRSARMATGKTTRQPDSHATTKLEKGRLTFTQGVSQMVRNFDRQFIPKTTSIPKANNTMIVSTQIELSSRPKPPSKFNKDLNNIRRLDMPIECDSDLKHLASKVPPLSQTDTLRLLSGCNTIQTPKEMSRIEAPAVVKRDLMVRSKSKPNYAAVKTSTRQSAQRSPLIQKKFEVGVLSGATSAVFSHLPTRIGSTTNATPKSMTSVGLMMTKRQVAGSTNSRNSKTAAQGALNQTQPVIPSHERAVSVSLTTAPKLKTGGPRQAHPLEFLAQTAIYSTREQVMRIEAKDRHHGLLINEQRQVYRDEDYAPSESTQNIMMTLNSSRVNHASTRVPNQQHGFTMDNQLPSRESLIELRKKQRESRQQILFGSATLQKTSKLVGQYYQVPSMVANHLQPILSATQQPDYGTLAPANVTAGKVAQKGGGHKRSSSEFTPMMMEIKESKSRVIGKRADSLAEDLASKLLEQTGGMMGFGKGRGSLDQGRRIRSSKPSQSFISSQPSTNVNENDQGGILAERTFHKPPLRGSAAISGKTFENFNKPLHKKNQRHSATRRINLTYNELDNLFKDMSKAVAQNPDVKKSSAMVMGTSLRQQSDESGPAPIGARRRVQSGNPTSQKHRFVQSLSKRSSMLFNQTVSTKGIL